MQSEYKTTKHEQRYYLECRFILECFTWLSVDKFNQAIYTMLILGNLGSNDRMSDFNLIGKKLV